MILVYISESHGDKRVSQTCWVWSGRSVGWWLIRDNRDGCWVGVEYGRKEKVLRNVEGCIGRAGERDGVGNVCWGVRAS